MINWGTTQSQVTAALKQVGFTATLVKADGSKAKGYAAWDSSTKRDLADATSRTTTADKQLYLQGSIKRVPEVGDYILQGSDQFAIAEVEAYRPATTVLAYRMRVV